MLPLHAGMRTAALIVAMVAALAGCLEPNPGFPGTSPPPALDGSSPPDGSGVAPDSGRQPPTLDGAAAPDTLAPDSVPPCGPATCSGCCTPGGTCLKGTSNAACGDNGQSCTWCGDDHTCQGGQCVAKTPATYQILLAAAALTGAAWPVCFENTCDLYLVLSLGTKKAQSSTATDQNSATWNPPELLLEENEPDLIGAVLTGTLWDSDYGPDQTVGTCEVSIDPAALAAGQVTLECYASASDQTPTASVTLLLKKQ